MGDDADSGDYYYDFPIRPERSESGQRFQREYQQQRVMLQPVDESRQARETDQRNVQQVSTVDMGYGGTHGHGQHHEDTSAVPQSTAGGTEPVRTGDTQAFGLRKRSTDPMLKSGDTQGHGSRRGTDPMLTSVDTAAFGAGGLTNTDTHARGARAAEAEPAPQPVYTKADSLASLPGSRALPPVGRDSDGQYGPLRPVEVRSGSAGQMIPSPDTRPPDMYDRVQPLMDMTAAQRAQLTMAAPRDASGRPQNTRANRKVFGSSKNLQPQPPSDYVPSPAERLKESRKFGGFSGPASRTVPLETIMARRNVFGASKAVVIPPTPRPQPFEDRTLGASAGSRFGALMAMRQQSVLPPIKTDSSSTVGAQSQAVDEDDGYSCR